MASDELNEVFKEVKISVFPKPPGGKIIQLPSDMSVLDAMKQLSEADILAAPVYDVNAGADESWTSKYIGILDAVGVVFALLDAYEHGSKHTSFMDLLLKEKIFGEKKISEIAGGFLWGPFIPLEPESSLLDALLLMGKYGVHRLPVVEVGGDMSNFLTQSSVTKVLHENADLFRIVGRQTLEQAGLAAPASQGVFSVKIDSPTIEAFRVIRDKCVGAVAVVGREGNLVGTVSARDVREVIKRPNLFATLNSPLRDFFSAMHAGDVDIRAPAVQVAPTETLEAVISRLMTVRIHRVFLCDDRGRPIRVISLTDVLGQYVKEPKDYFGNYFVHGLPVGPGI